ncbi:MAG TPA: hypothetical protein VNL14_03585 [Candidatus Acidoferrales bacterium]|nr:hypothetical protein [Candidatus Acidoferrales bacterium]
MGKLARRFVIASLVLGGNVVLSGCAVIYQQAVAASRQPGEHIRTTPDKVWTELKCRERELPFVAVESMELLPEMLKPGGRANYRLVYAMCPRTPSQVLKARVVRRILFKGDSVASNVNESLELKPGRWVVDSFFTMPKDAPLGVYSLEVTLEPPNQPAVQRVRSFVLSDEFYLTGQ